MSDAADSWESKKQRTVALSSLWRQNTCQSIAEACKAAMYLRALQYEITNHLYPIVLYNDSQSAQKLAVNCNLHRKK